jgi:thiol-disulfide isomerase/thioredoxin
MKPKHKAWTRRQILNHIGTSAALAGLGVSLASKVRASDDPPVFESARHQFTILDPREPSAGSFRRLDGRPSTLEDWRGKVVLLNFWASWCPQCRTELPQLDQLQANLDPRRFQILAISTDREAKAAVEPYLKKLSLRHLVMGLDPDGSLGRPMPSDGSKNPAPLTIYGMPMTYLIDPESRICGYMIGAADWASPEGIALLHYYSGG